ncbi:discoidin domain-containing protein [Paenibacillus yanchengensis]|uniref:Discoidin domain-containing protein n=1 Tax=Paenibacillus yanchengensis TaxID=2035833 RepID=A0ABW4YFV0_9BACL
MNGFSRKWLMIVLVVCMVSSNFVNVYAESDTVQSPLVVDKKYVAREKMKGITADIFEDGYEPEKAIDGIENSFWHTPWAPDSPGFPHWLMVEFNEPQMLDSFMYVARHESQFQFITEYEIWVSPTADETQLVKVADGNWSRAKTAIAEFEPVEAKLVKFVAKNKVDTHVEDNYSVSAAEIKFAIYEKESIDERISELISSMITQANEVLGYAREDIGEEAHQFKTSSVTALEEATNSLNELLSSGNLDGYSTRYDAVEVAITEVLASNKSAEEQLTVPTLKTLMKASADTQNLGYRAENAIDGDSTTMWHSSWEGQVLPHPHAITIDFERELLLDKISILPRQDKNSGRITSGEIYIGNDPDNLEFVKAFTDNSSADAVIVELPYTRGRYLKIKSIKSNDTHTAISEIDVFTYDR